MRAISFACAAVFAATLVTAPRTAAAQTADQAQTPDQAQQIQQQIDQLRKEFGDRLSALEAQLATITGAQGAAAQAAPPPLPPPAPVPVPDATQLPAVGQGGALTNA